MMINTATIVMNADGDITITTPGNIFVHAGGDMRLGSGGAIHLKSRGRRNDGGGGGKLIHKSAGYNAGHHSFTQSRALTYVIHVHQRG